MLSLPKLALFIALSAGTAACTTVGNSVSSAAPEAAQASEQIIVRGALTYRERIALPPGSTVRVSLQDISLADAPSTTIAEEVIEVGNQSVPIPFELAVDGGKLQERHRYAVRGIVVGPDDGLLWNTDTVHSVETDASVIDLGTLMMVSARGGVPLAHDPASIEGQEWVVEDIRGRGIIDRSRVTLSFENGRVAGRASCNRYFASYERDGNDLSIGRAGSTRMACAPALMSQETQFLRLLGDVEGFDLDPNGALILHTASGETILARRQ